MATYVYGNKITAGNDWRTWMSYEVSTSNTAVSVTVKMGFETIGGWVQSGTRKYTLTGTGQTTGSYSESNVKLANSTKHTKITRTWSWSRTTSAQTKYIQAKTVYSGSNQDGTSTTSSIAISVPALPSYTVSYKANGGSGAPASQTKWYNIALTLQAGKPTRTGYTFSRWSGSNGVNYNPSGTLASSVNQAVTMTAQWTVNSYTLTANANGGSIPTTTGWTGSGSTATKSVNYNATYGTLPTPTRTNYIFDGWYTSASGGTQVSSSKVMGTSAVTIYAHWTEGYANPTISNIKAERGSYDNGAFTPILSGEYVKLSFSWSAGRNVSGTNNTSIIVESGQETLYSVTSSSANGDVELTPQEVPIDEDKIATIKVTDTDESVEISKSVNFPLGGYPIHIARTEKAVKFFGIADDDEEGFIVSGNASDHMVSIEGSGSSVMYTANNTANDIAVRFGVGSGGLNHGLWSTNTGNWIIAEVPNDANDLSKGWYTFTASTTPFSSIYLLNNSGINIKDSSGTSRGMMTINGSNEYVFARGSYSANDGSTVYYEGTNINLYYRNHLSFNGTQFQNMFTRTSVTVSWGTIAANSVSSNNTATGTNTGYTALGVVGWYTNNSGINVYRVNCTNASGTTTVTAYGKNTTSSSISSATCTAIILWVKNT